MAATPVVEYRKTVCPLDCPDSCGMIAKVVDDRLVSLSGDPDHPYTAGVICRKMRRYPERFYGSERLLYPQVRVGRKGDGQFERISWPEAIGLFAAKLREVKEEHGGEAILPFQYAGNMGVLNRNAGYGLYHKLGTSRLIETICSAAAGMGWSLHYGNIPGSPPEVAAESSLIVAWGVNIKVSNIHFWRYITAARKSGAKLVVIDPYRNQTGQSADHYYQVLPGGDGALALGVLKHLLETCRLDHSAIAAHSTGFPLVSQYLQSLSWATVTRESGLTRQQVEELAGMLYANPATFIRIGIGLSRNSRGGMSVRAIISLAAALGLFCGGKGQGVLLSAKAYGGDINRLRFPELAGGKTREINMAHLGHALTSLTPPVKMFCVYSSNPLSVAPDGSMVRRGLLREDLFTVVHEQVMTPTARYADLLLPATTFLENKDLYTAYGHFYMGCVDKVIEPLGEAKSNFDLFQEVAHELGFTEEPFGQSAEQRLSSYVASMDGLPADFVFDPNQFSGWIESTRKRMDSSVKECSGVDFAFAAVTDPGTPSIACVGEPGEFGDRDLLSRFPFMLITPPHPDLLNSTFGERYPDVLGEVLIHPQDAKAYGVKDGAEVLLFNARGTARRRARLTTDTRRGLLVAEGIFWQTSEEPSGINDLTSQKTTDVGAGPTFHESRVAVHVL